MQKNSNSSWCKCRRPRCLRCSIRRISRSQEGVSLCRSPRRRASNPSFIKLLMHSLTLINPPTAVTKIRPWTCSSQTTPWTRARCSWIACLITLAFKGSSSQKLLGASTTASSMDRIICPWAKLHWRRKKRRLMRIVKVRTLPGIVMSWRCWIIRLATSFQKRKKTTTFLKKPKNWMCSRLRMIMINKRRRILATPL